jgi:cytochrome c553
MVTKTLTRFCNQRHEENRMFRMNCSITALLAMVLLFTTAIVFAQNQNDIAATAPVGTGDPVAGKSKSLLCQGCHGEDGNSLSTLVPKLAGQNAGYITKQVHNFQAGKRKHAIMNDLAMTVNDNDLADIAAYFSSRDIMKGDGSTNEKAGENLFLTGDPSRKIVACSNCHDANGKGLNPNPTMIPVIGGQNKDYLSRQLINFRDGDRSNSPDGVMNEMAKSLTDTEIESLAAYISGL